MNKLLTLLQSGNKSVQEAALTALASTADNAQESFVKYYDTVLPYLKSILVNANGKEYRMLRAKAVECISLVGMAVGRARFAADAREVMDMLMRLQSGGFEDDDPTVQYMLQAWTRLCKCLGEEFIPYLEVVMQPLLKSANLKADVIVTDKDDDEEDEEDENEEVRKRGLRRQARVHSHSCSRRKGNRVQHVVLLRRRTQGWHLAVPGTNSSDDDSFARVLFP